MELRKIHRFLALFGAALSISCSIYYIAIGYIPGGPDKVTFDNDPITYGLVIVFFLYNGGLLSIISVHELGEQATQ